MEDTSDSKKIDKVYKVVRKMEKRSEGMPTSSDEPCYGYINYRGEEKIPEEFSTLETNDYVEFTVKARVTGINQYDKTKPPTYDFRIEEVISFDTE